jgi:MoaA/NifB/PqqE/SkfB family radical SAM enzyme
MFYTNGIDSIRQVHLEISSRCNAACPQCPRNFYGYPFNDGYIEKDLSLLEIKKIFSPQFLGQLNSILINGNFGDIVMNPDALEILEYFSKHYNYNHSRTMIITNGGARNGAFWTKLAQLDCQVIFCLEGVDNETHAMYRQNTLYDVVIKNAKTFIDAGGHAVWKMIKFEHNQHQIDLAKHLSEQFGFKSFELIDHQRDMGPVYDSNGKLVHIMKYDSWKPLGLPLDLKEALALKLTKNFTPETCDTKTNPDIHCKVIDSASVYISSTGHVYPCCWLGMAPETYGHGQYIQGPNVQLRSIISENNALEYGLEHCIKWFDQVKESWRKTSVADGRLIHCNNNCGCN